jgi:hypothetical protein
MMDVGKKDDDVDEADGKQQQKTKIKLNSLFYTPRDLFHFYTTRRIGYNLGKFIR